MAIEGYQLPDCGIYNSAYFSPTYSGQWSNASVYDSACGGVDMVGSIPNDSTEHTVYENANGKITIRVFQRWNYSGTVLSRADLNVYAVVNGTMTKISDVYMGEMNAQAIVFAVDHETHYGYCNFFGVMNYYSPGDVYRAPDSIQSNAYRQALYNFLISYSPVVPITSNGGGATHIAKVTGQLSSLSNNLSDILMVSGGGGGGLILGEDIYAGKDAGGISGSGNNSANQTTGYAFGQGESADGVSGGGGGLYGGYKGVNS